MNDIWLLTLILFTPNMSMSGEKGHSADLLFSQNCRMVSWTFS